MEPKVRNINTDSGIKSKSASQNVNRSSTETELINSFTPLDDGSIGLSKDFKNMFLSEPMSVSAPDFSIDGNRKSMKQLRIPTRPPGSHKRSTSTQCSRSIDHNILFPDMKQRSRSADFREPVPRKTIRHRTPFGVPKDAANNERRTQSSAAVDDIWPGKDSDSRWCNRINAWEPNIYTEPFVPKQYKLSAVENIQAKFLNDEDHDEYAAFAERISRANIGGCGDSFTRDELNEARIENSNFNTHEDPDLSRSDSKPYYPIVLMPPPFGYPGDAPYPDVSKLRRRAHVKKGDAMVTPHGTISIRMKDNCRVDITVDRAVRIVNTKHDIVLSLSGPGSSAALTHPNGCVHQYGSRVHVVAIDAHYKIRRYAKLWHKGICFTSDHSALVYLVDLAGTRTATEAFPDMNQDFGLSVFYDESRHGPGRIGEAMSILQTGHYYTKEDGTACYYINGLYVTQAPEGLVSVSRCNSKYTLRTSSLTGSASITTPYIHTTASLGPSAHLFARRGHKCVHFNGESFVVRNGGQSAGLDEFNHLKVF